MTPVIRMHLPGRAALSPNRRSFRDLMTQARSEHHQRASRRTIRVGWRPGSVLRGSAPPSLHPSAPTTEVCRIDRLRQCQMSSGSSAVPLNNIVTNDKCAEQLTRVLTSARSCRPAWRWSLPVPWLRPRRLLGSRRRGPWRRRAANDTARAFVRLNFNN